MATLLQDVLEKDYFDYFIIGGGTAGLTIGAGIASQSQSTVLVLEAGSANLNDPELLRPASYGAQFGNDNYAWAFKTTKQEFANGVQVDWSRGKGLGGSSAINFMCYLRPGKEDFDDIERLGNPGWNYKHFNRLCAKFEGYTPPSDPKLAERVKAANKLGNEGPVKLSYPPAVDDLEYKCMEAYKNLGIPDAPDPSGGNIHGVWLTPNTYDPESHTRSYATTAYYLPNRNRHNYTVLSDAFVSRIVTKKDASGNLTATGVEFYHDGKTRNVNATKEVILCAGTLKSPQVLELSGIGQKDVLDKIGVPILLELPGVGMNIQEHIYTSCNFELKDGVPYETLDCVRDPKLLAKQLNAFGSGIFTSGMIEFCFLPPEEVSSKSTDIYKTAKEEILKKWNTYPPGLQAQYKIHFDRLDRGAPNSEFILLKGLYPGRNPPRPGKKHINLFNCLNHALSRGTIHAVSNDPFVEPEFDPRYFEVEADRQMLVEQIRFIRKLASTPPLSDLIEREVNPGADLQTDEQLIDYASRSFGTIWHTAGSLSMMPRDMDGVVDTNLKVYGTNNIRVADLSILPIHFAAHPLGVVYAIAEHAVESILGKATTGTA